MRRGRGEGFKGKGGRPITQIKFQHDASKWETES